MKSFSKSKLITGALILLLAVSLIGCSTTLKKSLKAVEIPTVVEIVKDDNTSKGDGSILAISVEEIETDITPEVEVISSKESDDEVKEIIQYPLGITPIVKSDKDYSVFDLYIVHTADVDGKINASKDSIGYARFATLMQIAKSSTENVLLIDAGNALTGSALTDETKGATSSALLLMLDYDLFIPQASDYAFGDSVLLSASKLVKDNSDLKILSANTLDSINYLPFQPYQLYDFNGFKICVVGLTDCFERNGVDFTYDSGAVLQNAQYALDVASGYADCIVVVGSMKNVSSKFICENLTGIDLFIDGSNSKVENGAIINGATIVNTEAKMAEVGIVDLVVKNGVVSSIVPFNITVNDVNNPSESNILSAYGISSITEESKVAKYISDQEKVVDDILSKTVVNIPYSLSVDDSKKSQSLLAKFFVKNLKKLNGVDASIISGGTFVKSLEKGNVSKGDINLAMASGIDICLTKMTGNQIYAALEAGYSTLPEGGQYYTQTDLNVVYNKYAKVGKRILRIKLGNKYIDREANYTVATDSVLCNDASGFDMGTIVSKGNSLSESLYDILVEKYSVE